MQTQQFHAENQTYASINFLDSTKRLPFPLNLNFHSRIFIALFFIIVLTIGIYLRKTIFDYLKSPETKLGPINFLIWIDQVWTILVHDCITICDGP